MDKLTLSRTLRTQLTTDRDVRIEENTAEPRILDDFELALAGGGDEQPTW